MLPDGTKQTCNVDCYVIEPESPATGPRCLYQGLSYYPNSVFYAPDDCNVCTCEASGEISCTTKTCAACDPSTSDHRREYLTHAVDGGTRLATSTECATLVIDCGGVASMFRNACGCGCEQPASCPEVFNCRGAKPGGPSCDVMKMTEACPFSEILF